MKYNDVRTGDFYEMSKDFSKLPCLEGVNAYNTHKNGHARPFICVQRDAVNGWVWLAPLSIGGVSQAEERQDRMCADFGGCDDYVFAHLGGCKQVINISSAFPVPPQYIANEYTKNGTSLIIKNCEVIFSCREKLNKKIRCDIHFEKDNPMSQRNRAFVEYFLENDYRTFDELSTVQKQAVVNTVLATDKLKSLPVKSSDYNVERQRIYEVAKARKDIEYNTHTGKAREPESFRFGKKSYKELKQNGGKLFYIRCQNIADTLKAAAALDKARIDYSAVVYANSAGGTVTIFQRDKEAATTAIKNNTYNKALGRMSYAQSRNGSCVEFPFRIDYSTAVSVAKALSQSAEKFPFRIECGKDNLASLIVRRSDYQSVLSFLSGKNMAANATQDINAVKATPLTV